MTSNTPAHLQPLRRRTGAPVLIAHADVVLNDPKVAQCKTTRKGATDYLAKGRFPAFCDAEGLSTLDARTADKLGELLGQLDALGTGREYRAKHRQFIRRFAEWCVRTPGYGISGMRDIERIEPITAPRQRFRKGSPGDECKWLAAGPELTEPGDRFRGFAVKRRPLHWLQLFLAIVATTVGTSACSGSTSRANPGSPSAAADSSVPQWLTGHAIPLSTSVDDATAVRLADLIGRSSLIGLGQPTHGTHEFMVFDQTLIEFAVTKLQYRTLSIEAPWTAAQALDDYLTGASTPALSAVSAVGEWPWSTHEMVDLLDWLRTFNATRPGGGAVHITTFDPQNLSVAIYNNVQQYFARFDSQDAGVVQGWLRPLVPRLNPISEWEATYLMLPLTQRKDAATAAARAYDLANANRDRLVGSSGEAHYIAILQDLRVIAQHARLMSEQSTGNPTSSTGSAAFNQERDADMAENLTWTRDHLVSRGGVIALAHNAHVEVNADERQTMYDPHGRGFQSMGWHLHAALGNDYLAIGGSFASGRFNAIGSIGGATRPLQPYEAGAVDPRSANATFAAVQQSTYLVDLRHPTTGSVSTWLGSPQKLRFVGGLYDPTSPQDFYETVALSAAYDAILHVQISTPTHLVPLG